MKRKSSELKRMARAAMTGYYGLLVPVSVFYYTFSMLLLNLPSAMLSESSDAVFMIATVIVGLLRDVLTVGLSVVALRVIRREPCRPNDIFYAFSHQADRYIILALLMTVVQFVCALPSTYYLMKAKSMTDINFIMGNALGCAGSLVAMILLLGLAMAVYLMLDHEEMTVREAVAQSRRMMRGNKGRLFYLRISFLGMYILALLTCFLGMMWVLPYTVFAGAFFYLDMIGEV